MLLEHILHNKEILLENLVDHAKYELDTAGMFDNDADYEGMLGDAVMELMTVFSGQGHSGASAGITRELFNKLSNWEALSPITDNPEEWMNVSEMGGGSGKPLWQNRRDPSLFSEDAGETYYHVDNRDDVKKSEPVKQKEAA